VETKQKPNTMTKTNTQAEDLKVGSIVRMAHSTYESELQEGWTVIRKYMINDSPFIEYVADCVVCNVTNKFFQIIIPHSEGISVRMSKRVFDNTTHSYGNMYDHKPEIIKI
jgi:hypothetical protein